MRIYLTGDRVENFTETKVDNIHCSPLKYQDTHFIMEGYQLGQALLPLLELMLMSCTL